MRIRQLARQLDIQDSRIKDFLAKQHGETIDDNPNAKLSEEQVKAITEHFGVPEPRIDDTPALENAKVETEAEVLVETQTTPVEESAPIVAEKTSDDAAVESPEEPVEVSVEATEQEATTGQETEANEDVTPTEAPEGPNTDADGTIRVFKTQLPGPKVVGKIDLPEESAQDLPQVEIDGVMYDRRPARARRGRGGKRSPELQEEGTFKAPKSSRRRKQAKAQQPNGFKTEEQKRKEAEARRKAKAEQAKLEKEKRKAHYESNHKVVKPNKKKKKKAPAQTNQARKVQAPMEDKPKSALGRLWKWFNS